MLKLIRVRGSRPRSIPDLDPGFGADPDPADLFGPGPGRRAPPSLPDFRICHSSCCARQSFAGVVPADFDSVLLGGLPVQEHRCGRLSTVPAALPCNRRYSAHRFRPTAPRATKLEALAKFPCKRECSTSPVRPRRASGAIVTLSATGHGRAGRRKTINERVAGEGAQKVNGSVVQFPDHGALLTHPTPHIVRRAAYRGGCLSQRTPAHPSENRDAKDALHAPKPASQDRPA